MRTMRTILEILIVVPMVDPDPRIFSPMILVRCLVLATGPNDERLSLLPTALNIPNGPNATELPIQLIDCGT